MKSHQGCRHHPHASRSATLLEQALQQLKDSGFKITRPRQALLKAIASFGAPFTTEEIFTASNRHLRGSKCDLVTAYRSLARFEDLGIISRVDLGDGTIRYEMTDPSHHHHHFICRGCHKIEPLSLCQVNGQEQALQLAGYTQLSHRLEFFGLCPTCS